MSYFTKNEEGNLVPLQFNPHYLYYCWGYEGDDIFYKGRLTFMQNCCLVLVYDKKGNDIANEYYAGKTVSEVLSSLNQKILL